MLDANHYPSGAAAEHCLNPAFWRASVPLEEALEASIGPRSTAVLAVANHGRWIAECPDCHGAQLTAASDPRFMCCECGNAAIGGQWRPVIWPKDHRAIGELLDERPLHLANAAPDESLKQIRRENKLLAQATLLGGDA